MVQLAQQRELSKLAGFLISLLHVLDRHCNFHAGVCPGLRGHSHARRIRRALCVVIVTCKVQRPAEALWKISPLKARRPRTSECPEATAATCLLMIHLSSSAVVSKSTQARKTTKYVTMRQSLSSCVGMYVMYISRQLDNESRAQRTSSIKPFSLLLGSFHVAELPTSTCS